MRPGLLYLPGCPWERSSWGTPASSPQGQGRTLQGQGRSPLALPSWHQDRPPPPARPHSGGGGPLGSLRHSLCSRAQSGTSGAPQWGGATDCGLWAHRRRPLRACGWGRFRSGDVSSGVSSDISSCTAGCVTFRTSGEAPGGGASAPGPLPALAGAPAAHKGAPGGSAGAGAAP